MVSAWAIAGAYAAFFIVGINPAPGQRRQIRNAEPPTDPLDYLQNKLNNARTTREYNNSAFQPNISDNEMHRKR